MQKSLGISLHASCLLALGPGHNHAGPRSCLRYHQSLYIVHVTHSRGRHIALPPTEAADALTTLATILGFQFKLSMMYFELQFIFR